MPTSVYIYRINKNDMYFVDQAKHWNLLYYAYRTLCQVDVLMYTCVLHDCVK